MNATSYAQTCDDLYLWSRGFRRRGDRNLFLGRVRWLWWFVVDGKWCCDRLGCLGSTIAVQHPKIPSTRIKHAVANVFVSA